MYPIHIEILLHYHCSADEFERLDAPSCREVVDEFLREGILRERTEADQQGRAFRRMYEPTERGKALVEMLCETPYPVQVWVRPDPSRGHC